MPAARPARDTAGDTVLYVSPHLDDAAWSCAGRLLADRARGRRVVVATVFTTGEPRARYRRRRQEDRRALEPRGIEVVHLGLDDAPTRLGREGAGLDLFLTAPSDVDRLAIRARVLPLVEALEPAELWLPLGVGGHVDHLAVFAALADLSSVGFYLDRPYAFSPAMLAARRRALEGGPAREPLALPALADELGLAGLARLAADDPGGLAAVAEALAAPAPAGRPLVVETSRFVADEPWALVSAYRSQWRGLPGIGDAYRRFALEGTTWREPVARWG